jgi:hypothetical protein
MGTHTVPKRPPLALVVDFSPTQTVSLIFGGGGGEAPISVTKTSCAERAYRQSEAEDLIFPILRHFAEPPRNSLRVPICNRFVTINTGAYSRICGQRRRARPSPDRPQTQAGHGFVRSRHCDASAAWYFELLSGFPRIQYWDGIRLILNEISVALSKVLVPET